MEKGTLLGFDGKKVKHTPEEPGGLPPGRQLKSNHDYLLPTEAICKGFSLIAINIEEESDPYVLYDRWGRILYQWPGEYEPWMTEIFEVAQRFL